MMREIKVEVAVYNASPKHLCILLVIPLPVCSPSYYSSSIDCHQQHRLALSEGHDSYSVFGKMIGRNSIASSL